MATANPAMMMLGATIVQGIGQMQSAKAQAKALQGQGAMSDYNAEIMRINAQQALRASSSQQLMLRRTQRQELGRQRAIGAQSGTGEFGTNKEIIEQSEDLSELDAMNLAYEGMVRSKGFLAQSDIDRFNANLYRDQASATKRAGVLSTIGTLAGGYAKYRGMT